MPQILIISPESWNDHFVSKHHFAIHLALRGMQVYFLGPPTKKTSKLKISNTKHENLYNVQAPSIKKGLRYYPKKIHRLIERNWVKKLEKKINTVFSTIWLFENSRFYNMSFAQDKLKIYHQVDSNQNFNIPIAAASANICFCTTDFIKNQLTKYNKKVYKIHHGVSSISNENILPNEFIKKFKKNKINAVIVGNLDIQYLDIKLLESILKNNPSVNFHLVGDYNKENLCYCTCSHFKNTTWWGKVESQIIPSILSKCDVSLVIYKANTKIDIEQLASPHKIMEYLASGNVTVASYTDEYKDKRNLLEMVENNKDYISKFNQVINELPYYNSPEKRNTRIQFAQEHTYNNQLNKIKSYLIQNNLEL